jgi:hypothetical protein
MKDLNELMQAILDMDAAQRKVTESVAAERQDALKKLAEQKARLAQQYADEAAHAGERVRAEQQQQCDAALAQLRQKQQAEAKRMATAVAAQKESWAQKLAQRAIEG